MPKPRATLMRSRPSNPPTCGRCGRVMPNVYRQWADGQNIGRLCVTCYETPYRQWPQAERDYHNAVASERDARRRF